MKTVHKKILEAALLISINSFLLIHFIVKFLFVRLCVGMHVGLIFSFLIIVKCKKNIKYIKICL